MEEGGIQGVNYQKYYNIEEGDKGGKGGIQGVNYQKIERGEGGEGSEGGIQEVQLKKSIPTSCKGNDAQTLQQPTTNITFQMRYSELRH